MPNIFNAIVAVIVSCMLVLPASAQPRQASMITVVPDVSTSSPTTNNTVFAQQTASYIANLVANARIGDQVQYFTIGGRSSEQIVPTLQRITRSHRPRNVGVSIGNALVAIPSQAATHASSTSIFYALKMANIGCRGASSKLILITDGWDTSNETDMRAVVDGNGELPKPATPYLRGCSVVVIGLGLDAGLTIHQQSNLESAYHDYFIAAGVTESDLSLRSFP